MSDTSPTPDELQDADKTRHEFRLYGLGQEQELEEAVVLLLGAIKEINFCHNCLFNGYMGPMADPLRAMNHAADLIGLDSTQRWWNTELDISPDI
jgi:hypothetical protein